MDALATVGVAQDYAQLLPASVEIDVGGVRIRVIRLEELIALKQQAGRPKDLAALPVLRGTLEESRRQGR